MLAVLVATVGRPAVVSALLERLSKQQQPADHVVLVSPSMDDVSLNLRELNAASPSRIIPLIGRRGLCHQRNDGVDYICRTLGYGGPDDVVAMIDDDFVPREDWLRNLSKLFADCGDCVGATGVLLGDGAQAMEGITLDVALALLSEQRALLPPTDWRRNPGEVPNLYGCNMAARAAPLRSLRFDERLPLYGWLEDSDFSAQLAKYGKLIRSEDLVGVHLGTKSGRISGVRFGYSQFVNSAYLIGKGTLSRKLGYKLIGSAFLGNTLRTMLGKQDVDYPGRLKGNLIALSDMLRSRAKPERILDM